MVHTCFFNVNNAMFTPPWCQVLANDNDKDWTQLWGCFVCSCKNFNKGNALLECQCHKMLYILLFFYHRTRSHVHHKSTTMTITAKMKISSKLLQFFMSTNPRWILRHSSLHKQIKNLRNTIASIPKENWVRSFIVKYSVVYW